MELKGSLKNFSLPDIVQLVGTTKRSGVLVVILGPEKGALYFEDGRIVHASFRGAGGQEAVNRIFLEREGSFQFLSDVEAPEKTLALDWMGAIMEAARQHDESARAEQFDSLDFEAALAASPAETVALPVRERQGAWEPGPVKAKMAKILEEAFGKRAGKILKELSKDAGSKLSLLEFCEKAEKYIYVFIDNKRAEEVAKRLRAAIEESIQ